MDQRRYRRRALHGIWQPGMEQELRRLAHGAHEQKKADQRQGVDMKAQELHGLADLVGRRGEYRVVLDGVEQGENREDAKREAEIADAVDDEGLYRGRVSRRLVIPEADQEIGRETDALPAEEELEKIVGRHQRQHGESEEREISEESGPARVVLHIADGIEVHEARDIGHYHQHHGSEYV